jgi:hypothetical protein
LNLALIALRQLIKDSGFIHTDDIETVEKEYNLNASTAERFVREKCEVDVSDRERHEICRDLYYAYVVVVLTHIGNKFTYRLRLHFC